MCTGYIRYSVNDRRIGSQGHNFNHSKIIFNEVRIGTSTNYSFFANNTDISNAKTGDIIRVEIFKRTKTKPRTPKDVITLIKIDTNSGISATISNKYKVKCGETYV